MPAPVAAALSSNIDTPEHFLLAREARHVVAVENIDAADVELARDLVWPRVLPLTIPTALFRIMDEGTETVGDREPSHLP
jgi:hypothetical protein